MLHRAGADLSMLVTDTPQGPYPYAGTPWFSTPFGRDGLITALQMLWLDPGLARACCAIWRRTRRRRLDERADAEPGKILHETRSCEMAVLGEVPFGHYYGSVDSTPLFVLLAARYFERTGDEETIRALWPNIEAALAWIDKYGDRDGDGFVEYYRVSENGLTNQGWKDSADSIMHADGQLATGPDRAVRSAGLCLCRQARARPCWRRRWAIRAAPRSWPTRRKNCASDFEDKFWIEELGTYALALDGDKRPCKVRSSNAGQVLVSRHRRAGAGAGRGRHPDDAGNVLRLGRAHPVGGCAALQSHVLSQWLGLAARQCPDRAGPGALWPEAAGARRSSKACSTPPRHMEMMRFPELFCGFPRRRGIAPVLYPVACAPQAWASVVPFALLQASLGLEMYFEKRRDPLPQSATAPIHGRDADQRPGAGRCQREPAPAPPRRRHGSGGRLAQGRHVDQDHTVALSNMSMAAHEAAR